MSEYTPEQIAGYKDENERKIRSAAARGDVTIDGMPLKVTLELTADCDLFCKMCEFVVPRERGRKKGYDLHMGAQEFEMLAPQAFAAARFVNLTVVGEPFLVPYLDRVLELCEEWQTRLEFVTHGMHLDAETIRKVGPRTQSMIISFDGGTPETFDRIRVGARFDAVTRNMLRFQRWREGLPAGGHVPAFIMAVTLMRENIEELPTMVRIGKLLGVDKVSAAWMIAFSDKMARSSCFRHKGLANAALRRAREVAEDLGIALETPVEFPGVSDEEVAGARLREPDSARDPLPHLVPYLGGAAMPEEERSGIALDEASIETQMRVIKDWIPETEDLEHPTPSMGEMLPAVEEPPRQTREELSLQAQVLVNDPQERIFVPAEPPKNARYTCRFLWNELFVALNGDVTPCCIQGRPVVGNVFQENLDQVWNGEGMREMRRRLQEGDPVDCCRDCNYNTMLGQGDYREDTFFVPLDREV